MSTMPYAERGGGSKFFTLFVIAIIVFAALKLLPLIFGNVDVQVAGEHDEADAIRCSNDVLAVFLNKSCERYNVLKQLDDGRVGDQVVQPCKRFGFKMVLEITSYVIGGGTLDEAIDVMKAKGCTQVWP